MPARSTASRVRACEARRACRTPRPPRIWTQHPRLCTAQRSSIGPSLERQDSGGKNTYLRDSENEAESLHSVSGIKRLSCSAVSKKSSFRTFKLAGQTCGAVVMPSSPVPHAQRKTERRAHMHTITYCGRGRRERRWWLTKVRAAPRRPRAAPRRSSSARCARRSRYDPRAPRES